MKPTIHPVKGTRDFYPEEMALRSYIYATVRKVSESFGYQEWDAPFLEPIDLYAAKSGQELVSQQSFVFPDRSGDLITLRPELTPSLARVVAQRQKQLVYPLRWWSWGPFWRYEKPQKGRTREFFQWNIDLIGVDTPEADAEMVAIAATFLKETGLSSRQVNILVNNRSLVESELRNLGIQPGLHTEVFRLIDRKDKMQLSEWDANALSLGLDTSQKDGLEKLLANQELWRESASLQRFFTIIQSLGVAEYVRYDPRIIRGLDYYTGTVFEAWDQDGEFRAILGGGRYDNLVSDVGGEPLPATGFAMGDLVASLVLKKFGCLSESLGKSPAKILVTVFDYESMTASFRLAADLRQHGFSVACYPESAKLGKQFKYGDRMGIPLAIVLGPDEIARDQVSIKNLVSGDQITAEKTGIEATLLRMLESPSAS
jgi:histidyl-tRNA synthetase